MIKQIKTGIKLLPYGYGVRSCVAGGVLMILIGCVMCLMRNEYIGYMGTYFLIAAAMWPIQLLYSLEVPSMVQTSPWKKKGQTSAFSLLGVLGFSIANGIIFLTQLSRLQRNPAEEGIASGIMQVGSITALIIMVYLGTALKYFVISTIVFCCTIVPLLARMRDMQMQMLQIPFWVSAIVSFMVIFLGAVLQYGITRLLYRVPISKNSQFSALRKIV